MIQLPYPPSINNYWGHRAVNQSGRWIVHTYLDNRGKAYRRDVIATCLLQNVKPWGEKLLEVKLAIYPPDRRKRDIDNPIKPILDALMHANVFDDDSQIVKLTAERMTQTQGGEVLVDIQEWKS